MLRPSPCQEANQKGRFAGGNGATNNAVQDRRDPGQMEKQQQTICLRQRSPDSPSHHREGSTGFAWHPAGFGAHQDFATSPPHPNPGAPSLFPQELGFEALRAACTPPLLAKPQAQLIDEWALDMIDLIDSVKHGDYLVLADFPKCSSRRHRTFVPLSLLTPLLTTNLCKDLAWPL